MSKEVEVFELWENGNLKLYYALRDVELYLGCAKEGLLSANKKAFQKKQRSQNKKEIVEIAQKIENQLEECQASLEMLKSNL